VDATTCELADLSGSLYTLVAHFLECLSTPLETRPTRHLQPKFVDHDSLPLVVYPKFPDKQPDKLSLESAFL
jgi:hypothetical protein